MPWTSPSPILFLTLSPPRQRSPVSVPRSNGLLRDGSHANMDLDKRSPSRASPASLRPVCSPEHPAGSGAASSPQKAKKEEGGGGSFSRNP